MYCFASFYGLHFFTKITLHSEGNETLKHNTIPK